MIEWLWSAAPPQRLAGLRILFGLYGIVWSTIRLPAHVSHMDQVAVRWQPIGVLAPLGDPLPDVVVAGLAIGTPILGLLYVAGWRFTATGPAFAAALLAVATLDSSWGQIFHTENLMVLHVGIVALAPGSADVWTFSRRRAEAVPSPQPPAPVAGPRYGWPVRLAAVVVVVAYVLAGIAKLRGAAGLGWVSGDVLRNLVAHDNLRKDLLGDVHSPVGTALVGQAWLFPPMAMASLAVEFGAWVALCGRRWRTVWVLAAWTFHVGVLALMAILFPYQLTGVAFAPFFRVERLGPLRWVTDRWTAPQAGRRLYGQTAHGPPAPSG